MTFQITACTAQNWLAYLILLVSTLPLLTAFLWRRSLTKYQNSLNEWHTILKNRTKQIKPKDYQ